MKIIVFGAMGAVGRRVVAEGVRRGHEITAVTRRYESGSLDPTVSLLARDVRNMPDIDEQIARHDRVVSALRPPEGQETSLVPLTRTVVEAARRATVPYIVVGGAAILRVPSTPGHTVLTAPGFLPDAIRPIATASKDLYDWWSSGRTPFGSYIAPPAMLLPGERTGTYRTGRDTLVVDGQGNSAISMEDFAVALLDETESGIHRGECFTVGY